MQLSLLIMPDKARHLNHIFTGISRDDISCFNCIDFPSIPLIKFYTWLHIWIPPPAGSSVVSEIIWNLSKIAHFSFWMRLWIFGRLPFYGLMTLNWIKAARVNVSSSVWGNIAKTLVRYPSSSRTVSGGSLTWDFQIFFIGLSLLSDDTAALLWLPGLSVWLLSTV